MNPTVRRALLLATISACAGLTGCATITSGTTQRIDFASEPPGATATLSNGAVVETPGHLVLSRAKTYDVTIEKDGYIPARSHIGQRSNPAIFGNILIGGLIGIIVDSSTGAAYLLTPEKVSVTLIADPGTTTETDAIEIPATP